MRKVRFNYRVLLVFMLVFMLSAGLKLEAKADTNTTVTFGETYAGTVMSNQVNKYSFSCAEAGSVRYVIDLAAGKYEMDLWPSYAGDSAYTISFQYTPANETYKKQIICILM